jgi:hypothetical protein
MGFAGEFAMRRCVGRSCGPDFGMKRVRSVARTRSRPAVGIYGRSGMSVRVCVRMSIYGNCGASSRRTDPPRPPLMKGGTWRDVRRAMSIYEISRQIRHAKMRRAHEIPPGSRDLRTQRNEHESLREDEHLWELRGIIASYRPPWPPLTKGGKTWRDVGLRAMRMYEISQRIRHSKIGPAVVWPGFWNEACGPVARTRSRLAVGIHGCSGMSMRVCVRMSIYGICGASLRRTDPPGSPLRMGGRRGATSGCAR